MKWLSRHRKWVGLVVVLLALVTTGLAVARYRLGWLQQVPGGAVPVVVTPETDTRKPTEVAYKVEKITTGLDTPWSLVFTSDTRWLVSERPGVVRIVENGVAKATPLARFSVSETGEEGLMGLALDPDYAKNKLVYACYATPSGGTIVDRVVRFEDRGDTAGPMTTLIDNIPAARFHAGCRIKFGPDKKLYVTTGDATNGTIAQNAGSLGGKVLRANADGSVPSDNPTPGSLVWSMGHRNPQGIAWQPGTDRLFATEHGPSGNDGPGGGDEVNIIQKAGNYGWPVVSHTRTDPRYISPLLVFTPAVAPSGATFYSSDDLPQFKGNLFFATLTGKGLYRVVFTSADASKVASYQRMTDMNVGRVRDVVEGPGNALYLMTSNRDGRGTPAAGDDAIYKISAQ